MDINEITRLTAQLQRSIGNFSSGLMTANDILRQYNTDNAQRSKEYQEELDRIAKWNKSDNESRKALIVRLRDEMIARGKMSHEYQKQRRELRNNVEETQKAIKAKKQELVAEQAKNDTSKEGQKTLKKLNKEMNELNKILVTQQQTQQSLNKKIKTNGTETQNLLGAIRQQRIELGKFSWKAVGQNIGGAVASGAQELMGKIAAQLSVSAGIIKAYEDIQNTISTAGDDITTNLSRTAETIRLGITPAEYIEMNKQHRQTILAAGGVNDQLEILDQGVGRVKNNFGSLGDATKFVQDQMTLLSKAGIKPSKDSINTLANQFERLQRTAGMTGNEFNAMMTDLADDEGIRKQLQSASKEQRQQILLSNAARVAEYRALGMTTEEAIRAAKALGKLATDPIKERYKKAARVMALGGALGISGAEEAAAGVRAGSRATEEQKAAMKSFYAQVAQKEADSRVGSEGMEFFTSTLLEKLDPDRIRENFDQTLANGRQFDENNRKGFKDVTEAVREGVHLTQQVLTALQTPTVMIAGGSILALASMIATKGIGSWLMSALRGRLPGGTGMGGSLRNVPPGTPPGTPTGPGVPPSGGSKLGGVGRFAGRLGGAATIGYGAYEAYDAHSEYEAGNITQKERNSRYGNAAGGAVGALAGAAKGAAIGALGGPVGILLGGLIGGAVGGLAGSAGGGLLGGMFGDDKTKDEISSTMKSSAESSEDTAAAIDNQHQTLEEQLAAANTSSLLLKEIKDVIKDQRDLSEKQLAVLISSKDNNKDLLKELAHGNRFLTSYTSIS